MDREDIENLRAEEGDKVRRRRVPVRQRRIVGALSALLPELKAGKAAAWARIPYVGAGSCLEKILAQALLGEDPESRDFAPGCSFLNLSEETWRILAEIAEADGTDVRLETETVIRSTRKRAERDPEGLLSWVRAAFEQGVAKEENAADRFYKTICQRGIEEEAYEFAIAEDLWEWLDEVAEKIVPRKAGELACDSSDVFAILVHADAVSQGWRAA